jgi:hypothetical protein
LLLLVKPILLGWCSIWYILYHLCRLLLMLLLVSEALLPNFWQKEWTADAVMISYLFLQVRMETNYSCHLHFLLNSLEWWYICLACLCVLIGSCCDPSSGLLARYGFSYHLYAFCVMILVINHLISVPLDVENHIDT